MKTLTLLAFVLYAALSAVGAGLNQTLGLAAVEAYVRVYPENGFLHVKEYRLGATQADTSTEAVKTLVKEAKYCAARFRFLHFTAMEESMKHDGDRITGEYHLLTRERDLAKMLEDSFGKILNRKVSVKIDQSVTLYYSGPDLRVGGHNAEGVYEKGNDRVIIWKRGLKYYEAVFGEPIKPKALSLAETFGDDVTSPTKSPDEISAWRKQPTTLLEKIDDQYQHDADIYRLRHLKYFGELIQEFRQKTGHYPLQGKSKYPNYVHIATAGQQKYVKGGPPGRHDITKVDVFRRELEKGLGRTIELKFDPQKVPVTAPNFYIYMIEGESYFFAVHLYHERSFANPVRPHYYKTELTNRTPNRRGLWQFNALMANEEFNKALLEDTRNNAWFEHLEQKSK